MSRPSDNVRASKTTGLGIVGGKELDDLLRTLAPKMEKNIMRAALVRGAKVIMVEAMELAPTGAPSGENAKRYGGYAGALKDSVRVTSRIMKNGSVTASVKAGGMTKKGADVYYAHIVEFGARSHMIDSGTFKKALTINGKFVRGEVKHPGIAGKPFMRPAVDKKWQEAVNVTHEWIKKRLQKEGIDIVVPADL